MKYTKKKQVKIIHKSILMELSGNMTFSGYQRVNVWWNAAGIFVTKSQGK